LDNGKPFAEALHVDVSGAASFSRYCAGAADKIVGQTIPAGTTDVSFIFVSHILLDIYLLDRL